MEVVFRLVGLLIVMVAPIVCIFYMLTQIYRHPEIFRDTLRLRLTPPLLRIALAIATTNAIVLGYAWLAGSL